MARSLFVQGLLVVVLMSGFLINITDPESTRAQASSGPRQVVIFVQGITSHYNPGDKSDVPFAHIKAELIKHYGYQVPGDFLDFSYHLDSYETSYQQAYAYKCNDTTQDLDSEGMNLGQLLDKYHQANPSTKIVLVGHSMGGRSSRVLSQAQFKQVRRRQFPPSSQSIVRFME